MLRYEASIRELFYRSCTADRSFVPQDDRKIEHVMGRYEASIRKLYLAAVKGGKIDPSFLRMTERENTITLYPALAT
jgi:hypothetical protein